MCMLSQDLRSSGSRGQKGFARKRLGERLRLRGCKSEGPKGAALGITGSAHVTRTEAQFCSHSAQRGYG